MSTSLNICNSDKIHHIADDIANHVATATRWTAISCDNTAFALVPIPVGILIPIKN